MEASEVTSDGTVAVSAAEETEEDRDQLLKRVRELLDTGENCKAWVKLLKPMSLEELSIINSNFKGRIKNAFARNGHEDVDADDIILPGGCSMIASRCIQVYVYAMHNKFEEAMEVLDDTTCSLFISVEDGMMSKDYVDGVQYVLKSLKIMVLMLLNDPEYLKAENLLKYIKVLEKYSELDHLDLVGLNIVKCFFMGEMSDRSYEANRVALNKLIEMDPGNPRWYPLLYLTYKHEREEQITFSNRIPPREIEVEILQKALKLPGAEEVISILNYNLMCLAEVFRAKLDEFDAQTVHALTDFKYGELSFDSAEEVVKHMKKEVEKIFKVDDTSVQTLFHISRIFSSTLPYYLRDLDLADDCISKAAILHPDYSKVIHRKGILCAMKANYDESFAYSLKAYRLDARNRKALLDALYAGVALSAERAREVNDLFEEALKNQFVHSDSGIHSHVSFITGVYKILKGRCSEGVEKLIESDDFFELDEPFSHFNHLAYEMKRFGWISKVELRTSTVSRKLYEAIKGEMTGIRDNEKEIKLMKILESLENCKVLFRQQGSRESNDRRSYMPRQLVDKQKQYGRNDRFYNTNDYAGRPQYRPHETWNQARSRHGSGMDGGSWRNPPKTETETGERLLPPRLMPRIPSEDASRLTQKYPNQDSDCDNWRRK